MARAVQLGRQNREGLSEWCTRIVYGMVLGKSSPHQFDNAEKEILHGIKIHEQRGSRLGSSAGYFRLGELYANAGRREEALQNLKKAAGMFREMGMDYWLAKAQEALARL